MESAGIIPTVLTGMGIVAAVLLGVWGIVARYDDRVCETGWTRSKTGSTHSVTGSTPRGKKRPSSLGSSGNEWPSSKDCSKASERQSRENGRHRADRATSKTGHPSLGNRPPTHRGDVTRGWVRARMRPHHQQVQRRQRHPRSG